jgi:hypothetical protein
MRFGFRSIGSRAAITVRNRRVHPHYFGHTALWRANRGRVVIAGLGSVQAVGDQEDPLAAHRHTEVGTFESYYVIIAAIVTLATVLTIRETSRRPLRKLVAT